MKNEVLKFPEPEPIDPELLDSKVEENSPEFQRLLAAIRQETEAKHITMDEGLLKYLTHIKIVEQGVSADHDRLLQKIERDSEGKKQKNAA